MDGPEVAFGGGTKNVDGIIVLNTSGLKKIVYVVEPLVVVEVHGGYQGLHTVSVQSVVSGGGSNDHVGLKFCQHPVREVGQVVVLMVAVVTLNQGYIPLMTSTAPYASIPVFGQGNYLNSCTFLGKSNPPGGCLGVVQVLWIQLARRF